MKQIEHYLYKILITPVLLFCLLATAYGQNVIILRGTIVDKSNNDPIVGAYVVEINENNRVLNGTSTDFNGNFTIKLSRKDATLKSSFIGYKTSTKELNGETIIKIELEPDVVSIGGVDVVAQAIKKSDDGFMSISKKEQTNSVTRLDMDEVETVQATSVAEAIQGRISGLDIASASGDPGSGIKIQIRGANSLMGDSEPLIIVDGLPYQTTSVEDFDFTTESVDDYSSLLDIPVENIKDIEVLKDAASAAIYGSKAANGVILITTKGGFKGKPKIEYNYKLAVQSQPDQIPMLNGDQYTTLMLEALFNANDGLAADMPDELSYNPNFEYYQEYSQNTNWIDEVTRPGFTNNHNLSVAGGGENTRYRISTGYTDEQGTTLGTDLTRFSTSVKLDYNMTKKITISSNFTYTHSDIHNTGSSSVGNVRAMAYRKAPNMSIYELDDEGNSTGVYFSPKQNYQGVGTSYYNPVAMANESMANTLSERLRSSVNVAINLNQDLNLTSYIVYDINNKEIREFIPQEVFGSDWSSSSSNKMTHNNGKSYDFQGRTKLSYSKKINKSGFFSSLFGGEPEKYPVKLTGVMAGDININKSTTFRGVGSNSASNNLIDFFIPSRISSMYTANSESRTLSGIGSAHINLFERYLFSATVRADGDSKFGQDKKWGIFPAFGTAWVLSEEKFVKDLNWVNFLKLRASYGINGRMPVSSGVFYSRYGSDTWYSDQASIQLENIQLSSLRWEKTFQQDVGLESSLFDNLLDLEADVYYKRTDDVIIPNIKLPGSSGIAKLEYGNFGSISNKGWELIGTVRLLRKVKDWKLDLRFNVSNNVNKVVSIPDGYTIEGGNANTNGSYLEKVEVGKPIGSFFGYKYLGVYRTDADNVLLDDNGGIIYENDGETPRRLRFNSSTGYVFKGGDAMYDDINKDGVIDEGDLTYLGNADPDVFGGFGANLTYKGFYFNPYFHYVVGQDVINVTRMTLEGMRGKDNQSVSVLRRWRNPGDITDIPRALYNEGYNYLGSDRFVEDASFVRLKTVSLGYRFNKKQLQKIRLSDLNVFCTLYNLYTWTKYTGQDPEVGRNLQVQYKSDGSTEFLGGKDNARTPPPRNITFGIIASF
ncbi:MAG: SusC/RagA family TonB-linked outer membrane protein [Draconibacterium sp.]